MSGICGIHTTHCVAQMLCTDANRSLTVIEPIGSGRLSGCYSASCNVLASSALQHVYKYTMKYTVLLLNTCYYYPIPVTTIKYPLLLSNTLYYSQIDATTLKYTVLLSNTRYYYQIHFTTIKYMLLLSNTRYYSQIHNNTC